MPIANGKPFLAIPGPTNLPDAVLQAMMQPPVEIYTGPLVETTTSILADLKRVFRTEGQTYIYAANGHGAWEAAFTNVLSRGDRVLVLESGRFAIGWGEMAKFMGVEVEVLPGDWRRAVDPDAVEARLRADRDHAIRAVLTVQIDTASGVVNDIEQIGRSIRAAHHPALYMVDTVASLGCVPFEMDAWGVDVSMSASQKGLMAPPGLGFVAAGPRARTAHQSAGLRTFYWDWKFREGAEHYQKYCGTPPEHLLFAQRKALDILLAEGLPAAHRRHALLAEATRRAVTEWAKGEALAFNILKPEQRSNSVTNVLMLDRPNEGLLAFCRDVCGVTVGGAIGALEGKAIRIAHMGHTNAAMVLGTLGAIEMGLQALKIPHGQGGVSAAITHLAGEIA
jgi:alanine-glyoxylate transaminase/serine-glyoxylate transaminase/serine-pyruvate transaminase